MERLSIKIKTSTEKCSEKKAFLEKGVQKPAVKIHKRYLRGSLQLQLKYRFSKNLKRNHSIFEEV